MGTATERIIIGVDPGTAVTGYAVVAQKGSMLRLITCGIIKAGKTETDHPLKLKKIFLGLRKIIEQYKPDELAVEAPFYGKNVQNLLKLGRAQGVVMAAALLRDIPVVEYAPRKIKQAVTGNGNAGKEQVSKMVQTILPEARNTAALKVLDASDALGVALCHAFQKSVAQAPVLKTSRTKKASGWEAFALKNPERVMR
jgi:crossover junction endodeoxyribonuclease RuvC